MSKLRALRAHLAGIGSGVTFTDRALIIDALGRRGLDWATLPLRQRGLPAVAGRGRAYRIRDDVGNWVVPPEGGAGWLFPATRGGSVVSAFANIRAGTIIDVGASFGYFTVRWAKQVGAAGRVLAVEPHPARYAALCGNVAANGLTNVVPIAGAAGDRAAAVTLYVPPTGSRHDASVLHPVGTPFQVVMRPLDAVVADSNGPPVSAVKIDVEGAEPLVLDGMVSLLRRDRPLVLFEALDAAGLAASVARRGLRCSRFARLYSLR